jgi:hypothetical protein
MEDPPNLHLKKGFMKIAIIGEMNSGYLLPVNSIPITSNPGEREFKQTYNKSL